MEGFFSPKKIEWGLNRAISHINNHNHNFRPINKFI